MSGEIKRLNEKVNKTADEYIDGMVRQLVDENADIAFVTMVDQPLRAFLKVLDKAHVRGHDPDLTRGAVESLVTSILLETTSRMVPRNNLSGAQTFVQQMLNTVGQELSFGIPTQFGAPPPSTPQ